MIFTVEPTVVGKRGTCNLEQDVLVAANGYTEISKPERELVTLG